MSFNSEGANNQVDEQRETILVVDDEPPVVNIIRKMLLREGYVVLSTSDPEEAIEIAQADQRIDLLLTDLIMPQLNGRALVDRVKGIRRGVRVLYMSGFMKEALQKYYNISIAGLPFLQKPFTQQTLARRVRDVLDAPVAEAAGGK